MAPPASRSPLLRIYFTLNAVALLMAGVAMLLIARSAGTSTLRLVCVASAYLVGIGGIAAALLLQLRPMKDRALHQALFMSQRTRAIKLGLGLLFLLFWGLTWLPPQQTAEAHDYFIGLYPFILCGMLASGSGLIFAAAPGEAFSRSFWAAWLRQHRLTCYVALTAAAAFALIILLTAQLHILDRNEPLWYGAGVPLLASQVFATLLVSVAAPVMLNSNAIKARINLRSDLLLFLLIWAVTAIFWAARPVPESYWVTGPRPPNWQFYPFSDLVTFDLGSQFALIGQGIFNREFFDRALYMSFLVYLHSVGGQDYQGLMAIQAAIFAVLPAVVYLVGRRLHSRTAGLMLAAFTALRGLNSLSASAWIDTATFKHMLTDFPTAIGVSVFVLLMLGWLENPGANWRQALWGAGVLGLTSLLRPHVLLLLPLLALLAFLIYRPRWKTGMWAGTLTLVAFFAGVAPWMFLGPSSGTVLGFYGDRIRAVIIQRYPRILRPPMFRPSPTPGAQVPVQAVALQTGPTSLVPAAATASRSAVPFIVSQFLHNLVTAGLIFPDSPQFLSVRETVKTGEQFWRPRWDGSMSPVAAGMLALSLAAVAIGLGAAYQRLRWRGLLPVAVLLIYDVANAFARSSGGRYLVPTDWVVVAYYAVGLATLLGLARSAFTRAADAPAGPAPTAAPVKGPSLPRLATVLAQLALIGTLVPLAGVLYPQRYPVKEESELLSEIGSYLPRLGSSVSEVAAFLQQPGAVLLYGRALYPRYYPQDVGEPTRYAPFVARNYPRVVFVLIGPRGYQNAILPGKGVNDLPNASDVVVLGCRDATQGYVIVSSVLVVLPTRGISYERTPAAPLACPLPEPVCDSNKNCH